MMQDSIAGQPPQAALNMPGQHLEIDPDTLMEERFRIRQLPQPLIEANDFDRSQRS